MKYRSDEAPSYACPAASRSYSIGSPNPTSFTPKLRSTDAAVRRRYELNVIRCASMPPKVNSSGGWHSSSTNLSSQPPRARTAHNTRWNSSSAAQYRVSISAGLSFRFISGSSPAFIAAVHTSLVKTNAVQQFPEAALGFVPGQQFRRCDGPVELVVGQLARVLQQFSRVPGFMPGESVKEIHFERSFR